MCWCILGNMLESSCRNTRRPWAHTETSLEVHCGVFGATWALPGAHRQFQSAVRCHGSGHKPQGPYRDSTGETLGHDENARRVAGDILEGYWEILWGVTRSRRTCLGIPRALWNCKGHMPTGALWGPLKAPCGALIGFTKCYTLGCSTSDKKHGWVGTQSAQKSQKQGHTALEEAVSNWPD